VSDSVRGYPLRAFVICLIAYTTAQMDLALFGYVVPAIRAEFGLTLSEVMGIVSTAFLLGGALMVLLGWLADRVGRLPLMSMFFYGSAAVKFAYLAEVFPTRIRALAMACCGSLAVTMGSAAGPYRVTSH
jgi:MFS family permease